MKCNLTLYGPVHSGKSTLAGLMTTYKKSSEELERMDKKIMDLLGSDYDPAQRIAYYVDTANDERRRDSKVSSIGTSKHLHYNRINMGEKGDLLLIDSPGSTKQWKQNYYSSFLADIGILVYSVSSFHKLTNMEKNTVSYRRERDKLLWQIKLWKNYKNLNRLIIVISKMDGENTQIKFSKKYHKILYANAVMIIKSDPELQSIPIVPIAIDVKGRLEHNIYTKSTMMEWYSGRTLFEEMQQKIEEFLSQREIEQYTFVNIVEKLRIKETKENVFRIKVLSGELKKGDVLRLTQVAESRKLEYMMGEAVIKSMKPDGGERTEIFSKGTVGGVTLGRIKVNGKAINAASLQLSRASYLIDTKMVVKTGNILCLQSQSFNERFDDFYIRDKVNMLMFGKVISTILIGKWKKDEVYYLNVYVKNYPLTLPVDENGELAFPNYVIEKENMDFLRVKLIDVKLLDQATPYFLKVGFNPEAIEERNRYEMFQGLPLKRWEKDEWIFRVTSKEVELVSSRLRMIFRRYYIKDYTVKIIDIDD